MFKAIINGNVMVDKNNRTLHAYQYRTIEVYSVNTFDGIESYFSVNSTKTKSREVEFKLSELVSLHKKFWTEGKTTFRFRKQKKNEKLVMKGHNVPGTGPRMDDFDYFTVFLCEADAKNLDLFLQNLVNHIKYKTEIVESIKPSNYIEVEAPSKEAIPKQLAITKTRKISDMKEYLETMNLHKMSSSSTIVKRLSDKPDHQGGKHNTYLSIFTSIKRFCTIREQLEFSLINKWIKSKLDLLLTCITLRSHDYPFSQLCRLFTRFKCLTGFAIGKNIKISVSNQAIRDVMLKSVKKLDVASASKLTHNALVSLIKMMPNVQKLKIPLNLVNDEIFHLIIRMYGANLISLVLKLNITIVSDSSLLDNPVVLAKLFREIANLKKFQIFSLNAATFKPLLAMDKPLANLETLKVSFLVVNHPEEFVLFTNILTGIRKLSKLHIEHIKFKDKAVEDQVWLNRSIIDMITSNTGIKSLLIGQYFSNQVIEQMRTMIIKGVIDLESLKVSHHKLDDENILEFISQNRSLKKLNICKWIETSSEKLIDTCINLPMLHTVIIRNDYDLFNAFIKSAKKNGRRDLKIVRKIKNSIK